jgi:hypothetical protein
MKPQRRDAPCSGFFWQWRHCCKLDVIILDREGRTMYKMIVGEIGKQRKENWNVKNDNP